MFKGIACLAFSLVAVALATASLAYDWLIYPQDLTTEDLNFIDACGYLAPGDNGALLECSYPGSCSDKIDWWEIEYPPTSENLNGADNSYGVPYIVGNSGVIIRWVAGEGWELVDSPTQHDLYSVIKSLDEWHGFIVGANGTILSGGGNPGEPAIWNIYEPSPTNNNLYSVCGDTSHTYHPNNTWAVGAAGTILDYENEVWSLYPNSPTMEDLFCVYVDPSDDTPYAGDAWACGANGTILRWDGSSWSKINDIPTTENLYCIWGFSDNPPYSGDAIFCVGAGGTILASEDLGLTWHNESSPVTVDLHGVGGYSIWVWAVGDDGTILSHGEVSQGIQPQSLGRVKALYYGSDSVSQKQPMSKKIPLSR